MSEKDDNKTVKVKDIKDRARKSGISNMEEVDKYLDDYEIRNIWNINQNRTKLTMVA